MQYKRLFKHTQTYAVREKVYNLKDADLSKIGICLDFMQILLTATVIKRWFIHNSLKIFPSLANCKKLKIIFISSKWSRAQLQLGYSWSREVRHNNHQCSTTMTWRLVWAKRSELFTQASPSKWRMQHVIYIQPCVCHRNVYMVTSCWTRQGALLMNPFSTPTSSKTSPSLSQ